MKVLVDFEALKKNCEWLNIGDYCGLIHKACNYQDCPLVSIPEKVNRRIKELENDKNPKIC
jgi:hypothetical protein